MKFDFDAELRGANEVVLPVYCEVQPPYVAGQKSLIYIGVPAKHIIQNPPSSPCVLSGKSGAFVINMQGVYWRHFPTYSKSSLGLEAVELFHIDRLTIQHPSINVRREINFRLAPISYLRSESSCVLFDDKSGSKELFTLNLPGLGATKFLMEWMAIYHRDAEILGATVNAGFIAVADLPPNGPTDVDQMVMQFKSSLDVLSVLFRQAVSLHGWTYTDGQTVSTWIDPLEPNVTPSARENRGDFVAKPQVFIECATALAHAYGIADKQTRSLVRHLSVAINPHNNMRTADRFLFMFSALERVIDSAWNSDKKLNSPTVTTGAIIKHLEQLKDAVAAECAENALEISERLGGLIKGMNRTSFQDKLNAFFRVYPTMVHHCNDLWPISRSGKERGLIDIRNALAHGSSTFVSSNVVAVAEWHLAILLERIIFVVLGMPTPDGISPGSFLLKIGAHGWYDRDCWMPLRSKPNQLI